MASMRRAAWGMLLMSGLALCGAVSATLNWVADGCASSWIQLSPLESSSTFGGARPDPDPVLPCDLNRRIMVMDVCGEPHLQNQCKK